MDTKIDLRKLTCFILLIVFTWNTVEAGISVVGSDGMRFTGADGIDFIGTNGIRFTGADGFINTEVNGLRFTGADGVRFTGADGTRFTGADGVTYIGSAGARFTGADSIELTKVDGMRFTGADGFRFTGADGTTYEANSIVVRKANGVSLLAPAGISLIGTDGLRFTGADGEAVSADGLRFTGADTVRFTGADSLTDGPDGCFLIRSRRVFYHRLKRHALYRGRYSLYGDKRPAFYRCRWDRIDRPRWPAQPGPLRGSGLQSVDPELALLLNQVTDDSGINAVVVFHQYPTETDLNNLRQIGILGGTRFRVLPMIYVSATRQQLVAVSQLPSVRSIYGNRTLKFDSDPYFKPTQVSRVPADTDLRANNNNLPVTERTSPSRS